MEVALTTATWLADRRSSVMAMAMKPPWSLRGCGQRQTHHHLVSPAFAATDLDQWLGLQLGVLRDDGVVVYLNGTEVFRDNLPAAVPIAWNTPALQGVEASGYLQTTVDPGLLVEGINQLAAEIHQVSPDSSDISFDLRLEGTRLSEPGTPRIRVQRGESGLILYWPAGLSGYVLESNVELAPAGWTPVPGVQDNLVLLDPIAQTQFYRLRGL